YHGSLQTDYWQNLTNVLPIAVLNRIELPSRRAKQVQHTAEKAQPVPLTSTEMSRLVRQICLALNYIPATQDYSDWLRVLMAVWDVLPDEQGIQLLEAWSPGYAGEIAAKFDSFDCDREDRVTINTLWHMARQNGWHEQTTICPDMLVNVRFINEIKDQLLHCGCFLIRSDMATGKSQLIDDYIEWLEQYLGRSIRALIVSHRVSLVENLANRFRFESYASLENDQMNLPDRLVITPNSLRKLLNREGKLPDYDLVVIDEIEQQFVHIIGDTFERSEGMQAASILSQLIGQAQCVLGLDAHASDTAHGFLKQVRQDTTFIVNTFKVKRGDMVLYANEYGQLNHLLRTLEYARLPIVVACESRRKVKELEALLKDRGYKVIAI
ncbi:MAG: PriCT-2 domain-containing protein, partial [Anaerolineae bacterium]|nr:PriCT-2 domain-containing protein [Anaerolineae bacterium]